MPASSDRSWERLQQLMRIRSARLTVTRDSEVMLEDPNSLPPFLPSSRWSVGLQWRCAGCGRPRAAAMTFSSWRSDQGIPGWVCQQLASGCDDLCGGDCGVDP